MLIFFEKTTEFVRKRSYSSIFSLTFEVFGTKIKEGTK